MVLVSKAPKQTLLDSFSRPSTRLAKRDANASQNEGPAEHATKETTRGTPKKPLKISIMKGKQTHLEDSSTPPRMAESSSISVDATVRSDVEEERRRGTWTEAG